MPRISIILPVYNGGSFLQASVESILKQSFSDYEFLILDDCSTDGSWGYLQNIKNSKVKIFRNERNMGLFFNLNFLINQSSSTLIKLWSQDDILNSEALLIISEFHNLYPEIGFSYTAVNYINGKNETIVSGFVDSTPEIVSTALHRKIAFYTGSIAGNIANVTLTRKALNQVGLFNENMKIAGDTEMWFRIAEVFPVGFIKSKIVTLRNHENQLSRQEKYYINHLTEELDCFRFLMRNATEIENRSGLSILRKNKLQFYMTLMVRAFLKGNFRIAAMFWKHLSDFDRMDYLIRDFVKYKILRLDFGKHYFNT